MRFSGVRLCTVPFESKLTLDSQSSQQELRIESRTQFSMVESRFQIFNSCETHQTGTVFVEVQEIGFLLLIFDCCTNLQPSFKF